MQAQAAVTTPIRTSWWRDAVVYQVYPLSFMDADGDGIGDIAGLRARLPYLAGLGIDAIWMSPWYRSPMADHGYDVADHRDIDPLFGTLGEAEAMIDEAHALGLRVLLDIVPNHTSDRHPWFQEALASPPGSPQRQRYHFRPGRGVGGELPPNDWRSKFGTSHWTRVAGPDGTPGEWYLHLFAPQQPDLNWDSAEVRADFESILRFWFDRGVDGFRIDSAHGLVKQAGLPDLAGAGPEIPETPDHPYWHREQVHDIYRSWRRIADSYPEPRVLVAEVWVDRPSWLTDYVRPDELHVAFSFEFLSAPWRPDFLRRVIDESIAELDRVGAPPAWTLSNHDVVRPVSRYGRPQPDRAVGFATDLPAGPPDLELGDRRARAAALLMLALPGSTFLYQGEELGLWEVEDIPEQFLQDPSRVRVGEAMLGRDGCRVPLPWSGERPPFGNGPRRRGPVAAPARGLADQDGPGPGRRSGLRAAPVPVRAAPPPRPPGTGRGDARLGRGGGAASLVHPRAGFPLRRQLLGPLRPAARGRGGPAQQQPVGRRPAPAGHDGLARSIRLAEPPAATSPGAASTKGSRMRWRRVPAIMAVAMLFAAGCSDDDGGDAAGNGSGSDNQVEILMALGNTSTKGFQAAVAQFEQSSGIKINITDAGQSFDTVARTRAAANNYPDIAFYPQPGLLLDVAKRGKAQDLSSMVDVEKVRSTLVPGILDTATAADGKIYGVPIGMDVKSIVWYPKKAFEAKGYKVPTTIAELEALTQQIKGDGTTPWCVGIQSGPATGWPATDWIEDFVLRYGGPETYDKWVKHEIPFNDPVVVQAASEFEKLALADGNVYGGRKSVVATQVDAAPLPMFQNPPKCFLHRQASFIFGSFPKERPGQRGGGGGRLPAARHVRRQPADHGRWHPGQRLQRRRGHEEGAAVPEQPRVPRLGRRLPLPAQDVRRQPVPGPDHEGHRQAGVRLERVPVRRLRLDARSGGCRQLLEGDGRLDQRPEGPEHGARRHREELAELTS